MTEDVGALVERAEAEPGAMSDAEIERLIDRGTAEALRPLDEVFAAVAAEDPERAERLVGELRPLFGADDGDVRRLALQAAAAVAAHDADAARAALDDAIDRVEDENSMVRTAAADVIYHVALDDPDGVPEVVPALRVLLDDEFLHLREKALTVAFGMAGSDPAAVAPLVPELVAFVRDRFEPGATEDVHPMEGADRGQFRELEAEAHGAQVRRRGHAARALSQIAGERPGALADHAAALGECYEAEQWPRIRENLVGALMWLARADREAAAPAIRPLGAGLASDRDVESAKRNAAVTLAVLAEEYPERVAEAAEPATPVLVDLLTAEEPGSRNAAVGLLSYVAEHYPDAVAPATGTLIDRLEDEHPPVREGAAWTLAFVGTDEALAALREAAAAAATDDVRRAVEDALAWVDGDDGGADPTP